MTCFPTSLMISYRPRTSFRRLCAVSDVRRGTTNGRMDKLSRASAVCRDPNSKATIKTHFTRQRGNKAVGDNLTYNMNRLVSVDTVEGILNSLGNIGDNETFLKIRDLTVYQTAFVHKSFLTQPHGILHFQPESDNDVLEFLGDACLNFAVAQYLVSRYPDQREGFLTKLRARLVRTDSLYRFARFLKLGDFLLVSSQTEQATNFGRANPRFYEDCFEAFIGAVIQDFGDEEGYRYAKRFIVKIMEDQVDFASLIMNNPNHKDVCQRYYQSVKWPNPVYINLDEQSPSHQRAFTKGLLLGEKELSHFAIKNQAVVKDFHERCLQSLTKTGREEVGDTGLFIVGTGSATKKSVAEQECAKMALLNLGIPLNW